MRALMNQHTLNVIIVYCLAAGLSNETCDEHIQRGYTLQDCAVFV